MTTAATRHKNPDGDQRSSAGFSYPSLVQELRAVGVPSADIAKATGVKERQVQHWAAGSSKPRDETRDRLVDVHYIARQLGEVYAPEGVEIWLHARNRWLDGARPIDLLEAGDFQPVIHAVDRLISGAM
jgi:hypothetical protein